MAQLVGVLIRDGPAWPALAAIFLCLHSKRTPSIGRASICHLPLRGRTRDLTVVVALTCHRCPLWCNWCCPGSLEGPHTLCDDVLSYSFSPTWWFINAFVFHRQPQRAWSASDHTDPHLCGPRGQREERVLTFSTDSLNTPFRRRLATEFGFLDATRDQYSRSG